MAKEKWVHWNNEDNYVQKVAVEIEYVETWDGDEEDMFWYDMELFAEDDEEGSCWDIYERPKHLICFERKDLKYPDAVDHILEYLNNNYGNARGDLPGDFVDESAKEDLQIAVDKFCAGINFKAFEETNKRIRRAADSAPPRPAPLFFCAKERESGEIVAWGPIGYEFQGYSIERKGSRRWYQFGHWSKYSNRRREVLAAIERSPYWQDIKEIQAKTKEEAIDEYRRTETD